MENNVDTSIAAKKDAVASGFQQRGTAEKSGVDTSVAHLVNECF